MRNFRREVMTRVDGHGKGVLLLVRSAPGLEPCISATETFNLLRQSVRDGMKDNVKYQPDHAIAHDLLCRKVRSHE